MGRRLLRVGAGCQVSAMQRKCQTPSHERFLIFRFVGYSDKTIKTLASELNHIKIAKSDVGFPLEELEALAREVGNDEDEEMGDS